MYVLEVCVFGKSPRNRAQSPPSHWSLPASTVNGLGLYVPEDSQRGHANIGNNVDLKDYFSCVNSSLSWGAFSLGDFIHTIS